METLQNEELEISLELKKFEKQLAECKKVYTSMLSQEDACCPLCKQLLDNESKKSALKQYKSDLLIVYEKLNRYQERYDKKHFDRVAVEGKLMALDTADNVVSTETIKSLENKISVLEQEKQENIKLNSEYSTKLQSIEKAKADILMFEKEIDSLNTSIEQTKQQADVAKQLYFNSIKEKMSLADNYLKDVKIRFFTILKGTGEIKDDFVITYKDKDFSLLSRSEKIAASLEIANMFNKITNLNSPLFIDDSESYPDFDFLSTYKDTQIFIAQVQKGTNLRIANNHYSIKGYKTIKEHTKVIRNDKKKAFVA